MEAGNTMKRYRVVRSYKVWVECLVDALSEDDAIEVALFDSPEWEEIHSELLDYTVDPAPIPTPLNRKAETK